MGEIGRKKEKKGGDYIVILKNKKYILKSLKKVYAKKFIQNDYLNISK